jgi:hypothetical protein
MNNQGHNAGATHQAPDSRAQLQALQAALIEESRRVLRSYNWATHKMALPRSAVRISMPPVVVMRRLKALSEATFQVTCALMKVSAACDQSADAVSPLRAPVTPEPTGLPAPRPGHDGDGGETRKVAEPRVERGDRNDVLFGGLRRNRRNFRDT